MYYLTMYNEPIEQPGQPDDVDIEGILKGIHLVSPPSKDHASPRRSCSRPGSASRGR